MARSVYHFFAWCHAALTNLRPKRNLLPFELASALRCTKSGDGFSKGRIYPVSHDDDLGEMFITDDSGVDMLFDQATRARFDRAY